MTYLAIVLFNTIGNAPFCVVTNFQKQCFYYNISLCVKKAETMGGICVPKN